VGDAYRQLISAWKEVLPTQSVCLRVPLEDMPSLGRGQGAPPPQGGEGKRTAGPPAPAAPPEPKEPEPGEPTAPSNPD
jgi:hypothetical protein